MSLATHKQSFTRLLLSLLVSVALCTFMLVLNSAVADAATMPDPARFSTNDGQPKNIRILFGNSSTINVPNSYIKIYSTQANPTVTFANISACRSTIRVWTTNSQQLSTGQLASTTLHSGNCPSSITWTLSGSQAAQVGDQRYYVWYFQGSGTTSGLTYMNMTSSNALFGYVGRLDNPTGLGDDKFAIQNTGTCPPLAGGYANCITQRASQTANFTIPFGTKCDITTNTNATLYWYDDDQNSTDNQNGNDPGGAGSDAQADRPGTNMLFDIYDDTDRVYVQRNFRPEEGNLQPGRLTMTFKPNHKYRWIWKNVADSNGIQFQLPYDSIYSDVDCIKVVVDTNAVCSEGKLKFRVQNASNAKYDARLRWSPDANENNLQDAVGTGSQVLLTDLSPGNSPGVNVYEFDVSDWRDFGQHAVSLRIRASDPPNALLFDGETKLATVAACATVSCSAQNLTPSSPSPGQQMTLEQVIEADIGPKGTVGTLYNAGVVTQGTATITYVSAGPGNVAAASPATVVGPNSGPNTVGPQSGGAIGPQVGGGGNGEAITWRVTYQNAGQYGGWVAFSGGFSINCPFGSAIPVSNKPYVRAWRGDVAVGCNNAVWGMSNTGEIKTYSNGTGEGSGTDLAAQALADISGFSSSQRAGMPSDKYMTFANTSGGSWGGNFGGQQCPSDEYSNYNQATFTDSGPLNNLPTVSGVYHYTGGTKTITSPQTVGQGLDITIYVEGDLNINQSISYQNAGSWANIGDAPKLKFVVRGDIRISHNVSELSGTYIAQPNGNSGGTIYTCMNTNGNPQPDDASRIARCSSPLAVYGSFVAKSVRLQRLGGHIDTANPADTFGTGSAAEKFIYGPEVWARGDGSGSSGYDSLTSLPPIF